MAYGSSPPSARPAPRGLLRPLPANPHLITALAAFALLQSNLANISTFTDTPAPPPRSQEDIPSDASQARLVLQRFLAAPSIEALAAEVRHPQITQPRIARHYANLLPLKPLQIRRESQSWTAIRLGENNFIRADIELSDFRTCYFTFQIIPNGEPKIDWESFANWAELPWEDFLQSPPEQAIDYRVTLSHDPRDQYYNYAFQGKEREMLCFKVEDPEKFASCWAYCLKDSKAASQIRLSLQRSRSQGILNTEGKLATACILRLRFPPQAKTTNQLLIEAFLQEGWVKP